MINQPTKPGIATSRGWKFLLISILILTIFFRFANLDQKVYSADEVRKILRFSGYTSQEFIDRMFTGDIVSVAEIQKYQHPTPEKKSVMRLRLYPAMQNILHYISYWQDYGCK